MRKLNDLIASMSEFWLCTMLVSLTILVMLLALIIAQSICNAS
jgi:hypothetical protein